MWKWKQPTSHPPSSFIEIEQYVSFPQNFYSLENKYQHSHRKETLKNGYDYQQLEIRIEIMDAYK